MTSDEALQIAEQYLLRKKIEKALKTKPMSPTELAEELGEEVNKVRTQALLMAGMGLLVLNNELQYRLK